MRGDTLYQPGAAIELVYFPETVAISQVVDLTEGNTVEIAIVGNEGMIGLPFFLGESSAGMRTLVQLEGDGYEVSAGAFQAAVERSALLRYLLLQYAARFMQQIAQSGACHSQHVIEERCAKWLLLTADRVGRESFTLTQEFLGQMLGVHRPTVTIAAQSLQEAGLIKYSRGAMTIVNRDALESASCECYAVLRQLYEPTVD